MAGRLKSDQHGRVKVWADGACLGNGQPVAVAGIGVIFADDHPFRPVRGRPTNNCAEIEAVTEALEQVAEGGFKRVHLYTDSQFVINCIMLWMKKWTQNGWRRADGQELRNKAELQELNQTMHRLGLNLLLEHVRGHSTDYGNNQADAMARQAARESQYFRRTSRTYYISSVSYSSDSSYY